MGSAKSFYRHVGRRVEELRTKKKLTQARLAEIVSLSRTSITNIENGRQKFLLHTLWEISQALGVPPGDFFPATTSEISTAIPAKLKGRMSANEAKWFQSIVASGGGEKNGDSKTAH